MPWPNWTSAARRSSCERDGRSTGESPATATSIILISADAVDRLVAMGPVLVGIDSVNIDGTADGQRPAHTGLLGAGIFILEHLTGLDRLDCPHFDVFAVPVKVRGMGSFPVRAFAVCDD